MMTPRYVMQSVQSRGVSKDVYCSGRFAAEAYRMAVFVVEKHLPLFGPFMNCIDVLLELSGIRRIVNSLV